MATASIGVRERMAAATRRIARVKLADRTATAVITLGGIFIIVCVLFIFVFVFGEALPLFRPAKAEKLGSLASLGRPRRAPPEDAPATIGVDEHQRYLYEVTPRATVVFFRLPQGTREKELPIVGLAGATVTSVSRSLQADKLAVGTSDGRVALRAGALQARLQGPGSRGPRARAAGEGRPRRSTHSSGRSVR